MRSKSSNRDLRRWRTSVLCGTTMRIMTKADFRETPITMLLWNAAYCISTAHHPRQRCCWSSWKRQKKRQKTHFILSRFLKHDIITRTHSFEVRQLSPLYRIHFQQFQPLRACSPLLILPPDYRKQTNHDIAFIRSTQHNFIINFVFVASG